MPLNELSRYTQDDVGKRKAIADILYPPVAFKSMRMERMGDMVCDIDFDSLDFEVVEKTKFCPKCGEEFAESELVCFNCMVKLKDITDINVRDLLIQPEFNVEGKNTFESFEEIFTEENLERINRFKLTITDYRRIIRNIKQSVLRTLDEAVRQNDINLKSLSIEDKVLLFAKSFVNVDYKSYGGELGYFEFNKIYVDDRQLPALMITTLFHELSHFLLKEIIAQTLCHLLDCTKTSLIDSIAVFILSYTPINQLIDEYAAHTVEGRFTLFGYQDYSSFLNIQKTIDLPEEEIEMLKTIANTFSVDIKDILESFIDDELLADIKDIFRRQILDRPDYRNLALENCTLMNSKGMVQAIGFVVCDGFIISMENVETLKEYNAHWEDNNEHQG